MRKWEIDELFVTKKDARYAFPMTLRSTSSNDLVVWPDRES